MGKNKKWENWESNFKNTLNTMGFSEQKTNEMLNKIYSLAKDLSDYNDVTFDEQMKILNLY